MATAKKRPVKTVETADATVSSTGTKTTVAKATTVKKKVIPDSALINVKSNVFGKLIYISKKNGERIEWGQCGEIQQITLSTLRNIKTEVISFFKDQWIIPVGFADENANKFSPSDIFEQLYISQYYKELVDPSNYEAICAMTPDEIAVKVPLMSEGARANLVVALNTYIEKGVLDSVKAIKAFEEALGCDLRELD